MACSARATAAADEISRQKSVKADNEGTCFPNVDAGRRDGRSGGRPGGTRVLDEVGGAEEVKQEVEARMPQGLFKL